MLTYLYSNIFESPAQVLVNTVNTEGVMGKGIAKRFRTLYPQMFKEYKGLCNDGKLDVGKLHLWKGPERWVLNFPTKTTWRRPSNLSYIKEGLKTFASCYEGMGIGSISFPPLGCGNGGLAWNDVRHLMEDYLSNLNAQVFIHNVQVGKDFVPEHIEGIRLPTEFLSFWDDVLATIYKAKGSFHSVDFGDYEVSLRDRDLVFQIDEPNSVFSEEHAESLWLSLRDGVLSQHNLPSEIEPNIVNYLFPVLKQLPYIKESKTAKFNEEGALCLPALYFDRGAQTTFVAKGESDHQKCLSL
jgi:O-acetyl-ADP-ribose deacetylase (regulator of RNase III)